MKQTIKQTARKYLGTAIVGAGIALGSFGNAYAEPNLPVYQETRQAVKELRESKRKTKEEKENAERIANITRYEGLVKQDTDSFNSAIKDGYFSRSEQERVYNSLEKTQNFAKVHRIPIGKNVNRLYYSLDKNLKGFDVRQPKLERDLNIQGLEIKVERVVSEKEAWPIYLGVLSAIGLVFVTLMRYSPSIEEENKNQGEK